jgi:aspartyl-tRNA(Asn)/glutamyl-tRNA(Gln) amidotransferase subunit A
VGRLRGWFEDVIEPEVMDTVSARTARLAELGCLVHDLDVPDVGPVVDRVFDIVLTEAQPYHREALARSPESFGPDLRANLSATAPTADDLATGRRMLRQLTEWLDATLRDVDVLISAVTPATAPPIGANPVSVAGQQMHIEWMLTRLTSIFNVAGLPALSVPAGLSGAGLPSGGGLPSGAGLPIGLQVIGRRWDEATVLRVGEAVSVELPEPVARVP